MAILDQNEDNELALLFVCKAGLARLGAAFLKWTRHLHCLYLLYESQDAAIRSTHRVCSPRLCNRDEIQSTRISSFRVHRPSSRGNHPWIHWRRNWWDKFHLFSSYVFILQYDLEATTHAYPPHNSNKN
ncbi:hypothetical protein MLD38_029972 [Melastoma candidum]|uniref:Uncharacterized protein n=1 Tax=Melastoma candidum TaxID=119954 RepID=A0ACB9MQH1_9MYRT|nr:hypothetical protein MLD38_029972 [Melastoma candidum]